MMMECEGVRGGSECRETTSEAKVAYKRRESRGPRVHSRG